MSQSQSLTIEQAISRAKKAVKRGNIADAIQLYNAVLQHQPNQPDAKKGLRKLRKQLPHNPAVQKLIANPPQNQITELINLYNSGQLSETERVCRELLKIYSQSLTVINVLAVSLQRQGKLQEAMDSYDKAIKINPDYADAYNNRAIALRDLGRLEEAIASCNQAIQIRPDYAEAYNNRGNSQKDLGQQEEAVASYDQAIQHKPDYAEAYINRGNALRELGQFELAVSCCDQAIQINPHFAEAYSDRGNALHNLKQYELAVASYEQAIKLMPGYVQAHNNLSATYRELGLLDKALASCDMAIKISPEYAEAYNNQGNVQRDLGQLEIAVESYDLAIKFKPEYAEAYNNRGVALRDLGQLEASVESYNQAIQINPEYAEAYNNRGAALRDLGRLEAAVEDCENAIRLMSSGLGGDSLRLGQLDVAATKHDRPSKITSVFLEAYSNLLFVLNQTTKHKSAYKYEMARRFGGFVTRAVQEPFSDYQQSMPKRLRVGFVSGDLRNHPVGFFLEGFVSRLNSDRIELFAYPTTPASDELTERIKPCFSAWKPIHGLDDRSAANLIHDDAINVLFDLSGHTASNRLPVFGWRPSPIQVSWLGYFATTGMEEMDYLMGDPFVTPPGEDSHHVEKVWRLPSSYLCFTPPDVRHEVKNLPAQSNGFITFGSFNSLGKVSNAVIAAWSSILKEIPTSKLLLKTAQFQSQKTQEMVLQQFAEFGITDDRLFLEGPSPRSELLGTYQRVDIALDPFPYPGGTTSAEALWMGVPVLTMQGDNFLSHVGETVVHNAGLPEWVAIDEDEYISKAVSFALNLTELASLRAGLRSQVLSSPLFDTKGFAKDFEDAVWRMWQDWQDNKRGKA